MKKGTAAAASAAGRALVGRRYANMTAQERSRLASRAASTPWEGLTLEERRKEIKRRLAGKGKKKPKRKKARKKAA
jgi:hypothetical protein